MFESLGFRSALQQQKYAKYMYEHTLNKNQFKRA